MGDCQTDPLRPQFDRRLRLEFHGAKVTSDAGLLAYRELEDALQLTDSAADMLQETRTGQNTRQSRAALLRQFLFSRLAGDEDPHDAERLRFDPTMRTVVGGRAKDHTAASTSEIARFEAETLSSQTNLKRLMDLSGQWIDRAHRHRKLKLFPRVGFAVTNLRRSPKRGIKFYNGRGTAEPWIKDGKNAIEWTRLSCRRFKDNQVRLQPFALAYNLGNFLRQMALPREVKPWSLTTLREELIKSGAKVVSHAKAVTFQLAEVAVPRSWFAAILERIDQLRAIPGTG